MKSKKQLKRGMRIRLGYKGTEGATPGIGWVLHVKGEHVIVANNPNRLHDEVDVWGTQYLIDDIYWYEETEAQAQREMKRQREKGWKDYEKQCKKQDKKHT